MSDPRPNVLLICADHLSAQATRPGGSRVVMTPTLDQLARQGVWFVNAYSACPLCIPARRTLMTGMSAKTHGDRIFKEREPMPDGVPTLAQCFRDAGYQAHAVGKLHVYPQRDRIGFDEVVLLEEGRHHLQGGADDWELELADRGYAGMEYASGVNNNDYMVHPWHLPEDLHPTNWAARHMCRMIRRRDPRKPGFWYLSFQAPHPPLWPTQAYLDMYRDVELDEPVSGDWDWPPALKRRHGKYAIDGAPAHERDLGRRAFYALITQIDHQIRTVIGYLREARLLDNTIIAFTSDHGDMLGDHGMWAKALMDEASCRVPMLIVPPAGDARIKPGSRDYRLVELRDLMPTLLEMAGIDVPATVEGVSMLSRERREYLYGENWENGNATRMVRDRRHKLIYYPWGNCVQLFDLEEDPRETRDLSDSPAHADVRQRLTALLIDEMYGDDQAWIKDGELTGMEAGDHEGYPAPAGGLTNQRGYRFM